MTANEPYGLGRTFVAQNMDRESKQIKPSKKYFFLDFPRLSISKKVSIVNCVYQKYKRTVKKEKYILKRKQDTRVINVKKMYI